MGVHTHTLRVIHKWIGLVIGAQFLLWTLSGAAMALLPMDEVAGGPARNQDTRPNLSTIDRWPEVQKQLGGIAVESLKVRTLLGREVYEISTPTRTLLFDAKSATTIRVDEQTARDIALSSHPAAAPVKSVDALTELPMAVREHKLPIWRVNFADDRGSSYFVSGSTGEVLERRTSAWRLWDFFWMLHIMDYGERASFNHPLIIVVGFAAVWLAITGTWLLLRTGWRTDFKRLHRKSSPSRPL
ncbi:hypothetical protein GCM10011515_15620 [Tsuneonella deserti]|uniref:PepSY-associated TM helix n=2 Tax=Tsuneonella deserti TaxID=2035528 RepID=A0ABQ1SA75_9SPHN|nr:hypothetical protein GCM10011515_15620 [Tsuneonella deserti]